LTPRKLANVLVVDGRPDKAISQTRNVDIVILQGKILDRKQLKFDEKKDPGFQVIK
jgi:imidazolonepropionase-like amidohydrolase